MDKKIGNVLIQCLKLFFLCGCLHGQAPLSERYLLNYRVEPTIAYVGQRVKAVINLFAAESYQPLGMQYDRLVGMQIGRTTENELPDSVEINHKAYKCRQVVIDLYPEKDGNLSAPAIAISIAIQSGSQTTNQGNLFFSTSGMSFSHVLRAEPQPFTVKPLPTSKKYKNVKAVGSFDGLTLQLQSTQCKVGDGLLATMTVNGDGYFAAINPPELILPPGIRIYQGKSFVTQLNDGRESKTFQWTLQPDHVGKMVIEQQEFVYFDLASESYKVLKTAEIPIEVIDNPLADRSSNFSPLLSAPIIESDDIQYIIEANDLEPDKPRSLGLSFLNVLIFILFMAIIAIIIIFIFSSNLALVLSETKFFRYWRYTYIFYQCKRSHDLLSLYQLLETIAEGCGDLDQCFVVLKLPESSKQEWADFKSDVLQLTFSGDDQSNNVKNDLFLRAEKWFYVMRSCDKTSLS